MRHCSSSICDSTVYAVLDQVYTAMHPVNGALPGPYLPARVTRGVLVAHRYTYSQPHAESSMTFIPLSVSLWNDLADPLFDSVGLSGFKSRANAFLLA